ncbi:MAG: ketoacyl-ACP synthase III, partial [Flavobacteriales bacterium]|nr:ketoacyl-ACP synthase III [Flavobacteriales bacterium]
MEKTNAAITGVQGYVPDYILTNKELENLVDTNDEWIISRTGVKERRILKEEGKGSSDLGTEAINGLLKKTNTSAEDIDLIICATATPDMVFPSTACIIADKVGAKNAFAYDLMAACSGFLYALSTASKFIETGTYKKVIVVGADKMSSIVDYTDRATCIIFGDGAGAVLLEPTENGLGIQDAILRSDGAGIEFLHMKAGGSAKPASHATVDAKEHFIFQDGQPVFKAAVKSMADVSEEIMQRNNLAADDVAWLVPHQANKRIIDATAKRMGVGDEKVMLNIEKYGNTTNGTIPLCLWEWENQLNKG